MPKVITYLSPRNAALSISLRRPLIVSSIGMSCRLRSAPRLAVSPLAAIARFRPSRYSGVASAAMNGSSFVRVSRPVSV